MSTFSGVGGFEIALQAAGHECVAYSEIDANAQAIYRYHFPDHTTYGDIKAIDAASLPDFDLLVGGFPCQSHSVAGLRGGFADDRGQLFFDLLRITEAKRPEWFIFENVAGLLSSDGGRAMGTILGSLADLGYGVAYRVLDSQHFGVPQRRRRVFLVGHLGDDRAGEVLALTEGVRGNSPASGAAGQDAVTDAGGSAAIQTIDFRNLELKGDVAGTIQAKKTGGYSLNYTTGIIDDRHDLAPHGITAIKGTAPTLQANSYKEMPFVCVTGDVAHTLRSEGADASEDGTGRGTPIVALAVRTANTGANGHGIGEDIAHTLDQANGQAVAFQSSQSGVRISETHATLDANNGSRRLNGVVHPIPILEAGARTGVSTDDPRAGIGIGTEDDPMFTLQATKQHAVAFAQNTRDEVRLQGGDGQIVGSLAAQPGMKQTTYIKDAMIVRRLTPRECERLMSWPDDWTRYGQMPDGTTKEMSDSARYRAAGNGVVSSVVAQIVARIDAARP